MRRCQTLQIFHIKKFIFCSIYFRPPPHPLACTNWRENHPRCIIPPRYCTRPCWRPRSTVVPPTTRTCARPLADSKWTMATETQTVTRATCPTMECSLLYPFYAKPTMRITVYAARLRIMYVSTTFFFFFLIEWGTKWAIYAGNFNPFCEGLPI